MVKRASGELGPVVQDSSDCTADGAACRMLAARMRNTIALSLILLCGEIEANRSGGLDFSNRRRIKG